jgi:hypothetical protein
MPLAGKDGGESWVCTWEFSPEKMRMTLEKAAGPYWFLYEGTPGVA